jgi:hypothetical protein
MFVYSSENCGKYICQIVICLFLLLIRKYIYKYKGTNCVKTGNCAANGVTAEVKFSMHGIMMIITVYQESIKNVNTNTKV